jgi:DNA-binding transcriptional MerR regulator
MHATTPGLSTPSPFTAKYPFFPCAPQGASLFSVRPDIDLADARILSADEQMRALGFSEGDINEAIDGASTRCGQGKLEQAQTRAAQERAANDRQGAQAEAVGSALESYTEQDLAARDEAQRLANESRTQAEKAAIDMLRGVAK